MQLQPVFVDHHLLQYFRLIVMLESAQMSKNALEGQQASCRHRILSQLEFYRLIHPISKILPNRHLLRLRHQVSRSTSSEQLRQVISILQFKLQTNIYKNMIIYQFPVRLRVFPSAEIAKRPRCISQHAQLMIFAEQR